MDRLPTEIKGRLVGTTLGRLLRRVRWWTRAGRRTRHPELWDMYLEDSRLHVAMSALIRNDANCLDVGAHVGSTLRRLVDLAPQGTHIAVEADPAKARVLANRFPSVVVVNAAVSSSSGSARFYRARQSGFSSLRPPIDSEVDDEIDVDVIRLDDLAETTAVRARGAAAPIDFMKLDVEGAELPAIQGGEVLLKRDRPVVLFECGPHGTMEAFDYGRLDLFAHLHHLDYDIYSIVDFVYGLAPLTAPEFDKAGFYPFRGFNYIAVPAGRRVERLMP